MPAQHAAPATQHEAANAATEKVEAPTAATALRQIDFMDLLQLMNMGDRKGQPSTVSPAASMVERALRSDVTNEPFHVLQTPTLAAYRSARQPLQKRLWCCGLFAPRVIASILTQRAETFPARHDTYKYSH